MEKITARLPQMIDSFWCCKALLCLTLDGQKDKENDLLLKNLFCLAFGNHNVYFFQVSLRDTIMYGMYGTQMYLIFCERIFDNTLLLLSGHVVLDF